MLTSQEVGEKYSGIRWRCANKLEEDRYNFKFKQSWKIGFKIDWLNLLLLVSLAACLDYGSKTIFGNGSKVWEQA